MTRKKCEICRSKIKSILPIPCKCSKYYCNLHKSSWDHNCSFDYINEQKEKLKIQNQKIISNKINMI